MIGWKKCVRFNFETNLYECGEDSDYLIVKLFIPQDAKVRSRPNSPKCRSNKAVVLEIQNIDGTKSELDTAASMYNLENDFREIIDRLAAGENFNIFDCHHPFIYKVGETVTPREPFDDNQSHVCSSGIHFFLERQDAVDYC